MRAPAAPTSEGPLAALESAFRRLPLRATTANEIAYDRMIPGLARDLLVRFFRRPEPRKASSDEGQERIAQPVETDERRRRRD